MVCTVIGLGKMGGAVARRLLDLKYTVQVYDIDGDAVERLVKEGATCVTLLEVSNANVVIVSLPNDDIVLDVLLNRGVMKRLKPGTVLIEMSTILPTTVCRLENIAKEFGVHVIDSPVSGGPDDAVKGELTLLVGASHEALGAASSLLDHLGIVNLIGSVGQGKTIKLVNNIMSMCNMAAACEAFTLGVKAGIEPQLLYDVLSKSHGTSYHFTERMPYVMQEDYSPRFALSLGEKDLRTSLAFAHEQGYPMPITSCVHQIYEMAQAKGFGLFDIAAISRIYKEWSKVN